MIVFRASDLLLCVARIFAPFLIYSLRNAKNLMNKKTNVFINGIVLISLALGGISAAEAQRLGGGKSFGSKPSYSTPYSRADLPSSNRVATPPPPPVSHPAPIAQQPQQPASSNQAWKDRALGAAAGLAVGGLVGSMMGDHNNAVPVQPQQGYAAPVPMQPQGYAPANQGYAQPAPVYSDNTGATRSSGGIGFFGLLMIAGLGYLAYRFFFSNKTPAQPNYQRTSNEPAYSSSTSATSHPADFNTDIMFRKNDSTVSSSTVNLAKSRETSVPFGFDSFAFLEDVKSRYMRLQQAWDARDLAEIRGLTTDKVFAEIQDQLKASNNINHTDILKLDADILEVRELSSEFEAVVLFDSIMREDVNEHANQVREVWHFVKSKSGFHSQWMLDGIQQLED